MDLQPTLENALIILRPLHTSDFEPLYVVASDPLIWEQHPAHDRYKKEVYSVLFNELLASEGTLVAIDKASGEIIGSSRFKPLKNVPTAVEIGWSFLSRKYWGGTYNRAMKKLMLDHAFQEMEDVIFYIGKDNLRSQKAVEKIGAVRITGPEYQHLMNQSTDDWTYRIRKGDWESSS